MSELYRKLSALPLVLTADFRLWFPAADVARVLECDVEELQKAARRDPSLSEGGDWAVRTVNGRPGMLLSPFTLSLMPMIDDEVVEELRAFDLGAGAVRQYFQRLAEQGETS